MTAVSNEKSDVETGGLKGRRSEAEYQKSLEEHRSKKEDAYLEKNLNGAVPMLQVIGGLVVSEYMATAVKCPLPQYSDRTVYFRTNNRASRQLNEPLFRNSPEYYALSDRLKTMLEAAAEEKSMLPSEYYTLQSQQELMYELEFAQYQMRRAEWLSTFVVSVSPWNYGRINGWSEDDQPIVEPIPALNPRHPETYLALVVDHQMLGDWCATAGFQAAVIEASRPFSAGSETPS